MKIGFLIRYFKPGMGGAENNCYYLARELAKNKQNQVHIFCSDNQEKEEIIEGIKVHRCKELLNLTYYFAFYPSITKKLLNANLDILHVHGLGFIQNDLAIRELKKSNPKIKIVCTPHGPFMALKYNPLLKLVKSLYTLIIRKNIKYYDKILQVNPFQKEWMIKEYKILKKKIAFLPNGIPKESFKIVPTNKKQKFAIKYRIENKFIISYLGRIQQYKGLDQIIRVLPKIKKICPNVCFIAIGKDSGDVNRLKDLASELDVRENILFTGEVSEEEKYALLDLSEIFVFPSEWEAFGISVLEAMARGNAVISTKTEGGLYLIKEKENGYLFEYGNQKELLKKMKILVSNDKLRKIIQKNNIEKARKYLWEKISNELFYIYRALQNERI
jgi:glycosyltransferase involved in cell wall biosynthesis